jgi:hypothetical protein
MRYGKRQLPIPSFIAAAILPVDILYEGVYPPPDSVQNVYRRKHEGKEN